MSVTATFRRQHDEISVLVERLGELIASPESIPEKTADIAQTKAKLTGKISMHLAAEDKSLYPKLAASSNANISKTARAFQAEMGALSEIYAAFTKKWTVSAVAEAPADFATEASAVLKALSDRIDRENTQLYPLADAV